MTGPRSYGDGCTSAHALDLVGERWALLVVRDLLFGPKRFTDLQAGLPHASPNVLTQRLRELEDAGVVRRRRLPPPASAMVYELTEWGAELEPILLALQRWGGGSASFDQTIPVGCDAAMLALKNFFAPETADGVEVAVEIRFPTATFAVTVRHGQLFINRGAAPSPDAVIETDPATLEGVAFGFRKLTAAEGSGDMVLSGDRPAAIRFLSLFPIPAAAST